MRLDGEVVVVTGGARGIGLGIAEACADAGAAVAVADVDGDAAREAAAALAARGGPAAGLACDVTRAADVQRAVAEVARRLGRISGLVNNAGILLEGRAGDLGEDDWNRVLAVNLTGPWLCTRAALPQLADGGGAIVNVASIAGLAAQVNHVAYSVSKAGLLNLTRTVAVEYGRSGVRCNAVCPGTIDTELSRRYLAGFDDPDAMRAALVERAFVGRLGTPGDIGQAAVFLLSGASGFVNGAALVVDGGRTARLA